MELDKSILLQKQVKDNSEDLQSELLDMKNWEEQMRCKDEQLKKEVSGQTSLPPARSKHKKKTAKIAAKDSENTAKPKRIRSYDYSTWDKFDVEKACKEIEKEEQSDDSEGEVMSKEELEKAHEVASKQKQQGNIFVQQQKWDEAITCYNEAIKVFPYDAIFYANRALCQLKLDNLHSAEADCSTALQLDENYVKAYHRRASARMGLKQYKEAKQDLEKVLKLEPSNKEAKSLLTQVNKKIEASKPIIISNEDTNKESTIDKKIGEKMWGSIKTSTQTKVVNKSKKDDTESTTVKSGGRDPRIPDWLPEKDDVVVVEPVQKPAHLRSMKALTRIPVQEVDFSKPHYIDCDGRIPHLKNEAVESPKTEKSVPVESPPTEKNVPVQSPQTVKDNTTEKKHDFTEVQKSSEYIIDMTPVPKTAVQFLTHWRRDKSTVFRYEYLKQLPSNSLPKIFQDSMESDIFSEILEILRTEFMERKDPIFSYLNDLSQVKRFRALIMFMNNAEKDGLRTLFEYCKTVEKTPDTEMRTLYNLYEI